MKPIKNYQNKILSEEEVRKLLSSQHVDWYHLSTESELSEGFIREYSDKVNWHQICIHQKLSENFIREFFNKVNWALISIHQKLSENFIREFSNKVQFDHIFNYQKLSKEFHREFYMFKPFFSKKILSTRKMKGIITGDFIKKIYEPEKIFQILNINDEEFKIININDGSLIKEDRFGFKHKYILIEEYILRCREIAQENKDELDYMMAFSSLDEKQKKYLNYLQYFSNYDLIISQELSNLESNINLNKEQIEYKNYLKNILIKLNIV